MHSKSLLRAVCEIIKEENEEMAVMSKSADVWEDDLIHVADRFVGYGVGRMIEAYYPGFKSIKPDQQAWSAIFARDFPGAVRILKQAQPKSATLDLLHGLALLGIGDKQEGRRWPP
jgi:hypothetical protein